MVSSPSTFIKTSQIVEESTPVLETTETVSSSMKVQLSTTIQTPALREESTMTTSTVVQQFSSDVIKPTESLSVSPMTSSKPCHDKPKVVQMDLKFQGKLKVVCL